MPSSSPKNSSSPPPSSGGYCRWGPYAGSSDFDVHMATILVILVLSTIVAFTLHAALRFLLRLFRRSPHSSQQHKQHNHSASSLADAMPTLVFSPGTKLAGGADCAICLSELAEGDRVRVLPACNHGFHVKCVEGWLVSKLSCPTCRASCRPVAVAVAEP